MSSHLQYFDIDCYNPNLRKCVCNQIIHSRTFVQYGPVLWHYLMGEKINSLEK